MKATTATKLDRITGIFSNKNKIKGKKLQKKFLPADPKLPPRIVLPEWLMLQRTFYQTFYQFAIDTSIHGVKHFFMKFEAGELRKHAKLKLLFNRIFWIIAISLCTILCFLLIGLTYNAYVTTLTVTSIETNTYSISEVPVPAVTICNTQKVYLPFAGSVFEKLSAKGIGREQAVQYLNSLSKLISFEMETNASILAVENILLESGYDIKTLIYNLTEPCHHFLTNCSLKGDMKPCNELFRIVQSNMGYCCAFNYYALRPDLELNITKRREPERAQGAGRFVGLSVHINVSKTSSVAAIRQYAGILAIVHVPDEYPEFSSSVDVVQPGTEVELRINPLLVVSTDEINKLSMESRRCTFPDEIQLKMAQVYSFQNCLSECRAQLIMKLCTCLPYYYPNFDKKNLNVTTCRLRDLPCLHRNRKTFLSIQTTNNVSDMNGLSCDCQPDCTELVFSSDRMNTNISSHTMFGNQSILHVFFNSLACPKYRRDVYMTWDALMSSLGAVFSLCLGGSIVSLVELLYFWTYRFYLEFKRQRVKIKWEGVKQKLALKPTAQRLHW